MEFCDIYKSMAKKGTVELARAAATRLKERGELDLARAVEELLREVQRAAVPPLDYLTTTEAGELLGVTGQTIKNWVREGRLVGFRLGGRVVVPRSALEAYARRAGASLDLEEL